MTVTADLESHTCVISAIEQGAIAAAQYISVKVKVATKRHARIAQLQLRVLGGVYGVTLSFAKIAVSTNTATKGISFASIVRV
jgi:hypothetical protein